MLPFVRHADDCLRISMLIANEVREHLLSARRRVLALTRDVTGPRLFGPKLDIVNPPIWELGHIGWFHERWCLRRNGDGSLADSIIEHADTRYNSAIIPHAARWTTELLDPVQTRQYLSDALERVLEALDRRPEDPELLYFAELSAAHEDMHAEAFHYTWHTLGYEEPLIMAPSAAGKPTVRSDIGDVELPGGTFMLGAYPETGFVFDNEKWAHEVTVAPFAIANAPVTNAQYLEFVAANGYQRREFWCEEGWRWRTSTALVAPKYWRRRGEVWAERRFDRIVELVPDHPVVHINWFEAQAYCRFARRRLPSEQEWEFAACYPHTGRDKQRFPWGSEFPHGALANLDGTQPVSVHAAAAGAAPCGARQMIGNVWEWTSSAFEPFPGYVRDPYAEYSEPWFRTHKVLRGGSFSTSPRLIRNTWRNFYLPHRNDPFLGFRTCRLDP